MMTLGDFFSAAPHARPVNPRPVTFRAGTSEEVLPGGADNKTGAYVCATVRGCFAFQNTQATFEARDRAHKALADIFKESAPTSGETEFEVKVQVLSRALREYDEKTKQAGGVLFPTADLLRKLVVPAEIGRLYALYEKYVEDEHPEEVPQDSFRGHEGGSTKVSVGAPGR